MRFIDLVGRPVFLLMFLMMLCAGAAEQGMSGDLGCAGGPSLVGFFASANGDDLRTGLLFGSLFALILLVCVFVAGRMRRARSGFAVATRDGKSPASILRRIFIVELTTPQTCFRPASRSGLSCDYGRAARVMLARLSAPHVACKRRNCFLHGDVLANGDAPTRGDGMRPTNFRWRC
ncbi:hypothetical protein BW13_10810 [Bifidobacterium sp. UTCIF-37]|uniref:hypothetical protein n=1 Tax=unclassified Bifidobacterium TaxID=2608897 RepID=UPI002158E2A2|nr:MULTISPECIES: hypothetical protein [unclassified Bifidobacterium]TPF85450.1 hypothetical protein BW13_10810 [Bifidobacterium sp. UTCIF-37]TPF87522.1 hypothetical protein BW11_10920 [Bifidobacterium sp. UTCIF-38]